jgi:hypothetical protein
VARQARQRDDWSTWEATAGQLLTRRFAIAHRRRVGQTFEPSFRRHVDGRLSTKREGS